VETTELVIIKLFIVHHQTQ